MPFNLTKEEESKLIKVVKGLQAVGAPLDALFFTPMRNLQVFDAGMYSKFTGVAGHPILTAIILGVSFLGSLSFVAKLSQELQVSNLQKVLDNMMKEFPSYTLGSDKYPSWNSTLIPVDVVSELKEYFDQQLQNKQLYHLQAQVTVANKRRFKNLFKKKDEASLTIKYSQSLQDILDGENWDRYKDKNIVDLSNALMNENELTLLLAALKPVEVNNQAESATDSENTFDAAAERAVFDNNPSASSGAATNDLEFIYDSDYFGEDGDTPPPKQEWFERSLNQMTTQQETQWSQLAANENNPDKALVMHLTQNSQNVMTKAQQLVNDNQLDRSVLERLGTLIELNKLFITTKKKNDTTEFVKIDFSQTLAKSREQALHRLHKVSAKDVVKGVYDGAYEYSFNFWLAYFSYDLMSGQDDTGLWSKLAQIAVIAVAGAITLAQGLLTLWSKLRNKSKNKNTPFVTKHSSKSLISDLLRKFFIDESHQAQLRNADSYKSQVHVEGESLERLNAQIANILASKSTESESTASATKPKSLIDEQIQLLEREANQEGGFRRFKRAASIYLSSIALQGIVVSFVAWSVGAILLVAGAATAGALLLGNIGAVAAFGAGMLLGAVMGRSKHKKNVEERKQLALQLQENQPKIEKLKLLELQNTRLKSLISEYGQKQAEPLSLVEPHDDRAFRRLTTTKTTRWSFIKKTLNRAYEAVSKLGTGVLIVRLLVFPAIALGVGGITGGPIGLALGLGVGLVWMGYSLYKYHHERKLLVAKRLLDEIDHRIMVAENNQKVYLKQLGTTPGPVVNDEQALRKQLGEKILAEQKAVVASIPPAESELTTKDVMTQEKMEVQRKQLLDEIDSVDQSLDEILFFRGKTSSLTTEVPKPTPAAVPTVTAVTDKTPQAMSSADKQARLDTIRKICKIRDNKVLRLARSTSDNHLNDETDTDGERVHESDGKTGKAEMTQRHRSASI